MVLATFLELDAKECREKLSVKGLKPLDSNLAFHDSNVHSYPSPASTSSDGTATFNHSVSSFTEKTSRYPSSLPNSKQLPFCNVANFHSDSSSNAQFISDSLPQASPSNTFSFAPLMFPITPLPEVTTSTSLELRISPELPPPSKLEPMADTMHWLPFHQLVSSDVCYCPICNIPFTGQDRISNRQRHINNFHSGKGPSVCPECGKEFSRSDNLLKHCRECH